MCFHVPCTAPLSCWFPLSSGLSSATTASGIKHKDKTVPVGQPIKSNEKNNNNQQLVTVCGSTMNRKQNPNTEKERLNECMLENDPAAQINQIIRNISLVDVNHY